MRPGPSARWPPFDFYNIESRVLRPWAFSDAEDNDVRRRRFQALGNALGIADLERRCARTRCWDCCVHWLETGNQTARWAAARAYAQVGLRYPREAMSQWRAILESESSLHLRLTEDFGIILRHPLHMSVIDAVTYRSSCAAVELPHRLRPVYEQALEGPRRLGRGGCS